MLKNLTLAAAAVILLAGSARADDGLTAADIDVAKISDADNTVVETNLDLDVDALAKKAGGKADEAVEACFRRWGGWGGYGCNYGYNYGCYSPCYSYSYCYPTYYCYRPVHYCTPCYSYSYCYSYPLYGWGCY